MSLPTVKSVQVCFLLMQPFRNVGISKAMKNSHTLLLKFSGVQKHLQIPEPQILYWSSSYPVICSTSKNLKASWGRWDVRNWIRGFCVSLFQCMVQCSELYRNGFMVYNFKYLQQRHFSHIWSENMLWSHSSRGWDIPHFTVFLCLLNLPHQSWLL